MSNVQPWYKRLYNRLLVKGVQPRDADAMVKGSGKHARGKVKPLNYDAKRKTRRKMAKASRRINRRML